MVGYIKVCLYYKLSADWVFSHFEMHFLALFNDVFCFNSTLFAINIVNLLSVSVSFFF